jgi:hypothetical protein
MRTQAYHGGDKYTGVDIGVLMEKSDDIMTDIHQYLQELDHPLKEATYGETFDICDLIETPPFVFCFPYFERITTR